MKKLINSPDRVVDEALAGMVAAHGDLIRVESPNIVVRKDAPRSGKVGVISGGGSGHEPMHGGFVGLGMLDAACPGAVFTSPVPDQMLGSHQGGRRRSRRPPHRQELHRRHHELRDRRRIGRCRGHRGHGGRHRGRCRCPGFALHRGSPWCRRHRAGGEDRRRGGRIGCRPGDRHGALPEGPGQRPLDGHGAHELHRPVCRQADVRDRRRRDGDRRRHPRGAGSSPGQARTG